MNDEIEDQNTDSPSEEKFEIDEDKLVVLEQKLADLAQLFEAKLEMMNLPAEPSTEARWLDLIDNVLAGETSHKWVRDAHIENLSDGGEPLDVRVNILDTAWVSTATEGLVFHHRYEVEFYSDLRATHPDSNSAAVSPRAKIAVTFGFLFYEGQYEEEMYSLLMAGAGNPNVIRKSSLYKHSWPMLREYVQAQVLLFDWSPLDLPETMERLTLPEASSQIQLLYLH